MRIIWQLLVGAVAGFFVAYFFLFAFNLELSKYKLYFIVSLYVLTFIVFISAIVLYRQINHLHQQTFTGELEDEMETEKYRNFNDYSLLVQSGTVIALVALGLSMIISIYDVLTFIGFFFLLLGYGLQAFMVRLMQKVYPERNLPGLDESNYANKVLEAADEGERHIMVQGLYKSHQLLNVLLSFAIIIATIYSITSNNSQVFSILLMGAVLLLTNGRYILAVRNK